MVSVAGVVFVAPLSAIVTGNEVLPAGVTRNPSVAFVPLIFTPMAMANFRLLLSRGFRFGRHVDPLLLRRADDLDPLRPEDSVERYRYEVRRGRDPDDADAVQRADDLDAPIVRLADVDEGTQLDGHVQTRLDSGDDE